MQFIGENNIMFSEKWIKVIMMIIDFFQIFPVAGN